LYAHFSESLSGVTVIRAYGEGDRFIADNQKLMAIETRAYYLTVANQRWLGIRLDALGSVLVFVVAVIVACSDTISPASSGLVRNVIRGFSTRLNVLPLSDIIVFRHSSTVVLLDRSSVCGSAE
jgi:ABC-type multidrug transport system fused ATPase/permease subunit